MQSNLNLLQIFRPGLRIPIFLSLSLTLITALLVAAYFKLAQPELPLFYSLSDAQQLLQPKVLFFVLPGVSLTISLVTMVTIAIMDSIEISMLKLYTWASVSSQIILFMAAIRIVYITA